MILVSMLLLLGAAKLHSAGQIMQRMQTSPIAYDFATLEQITDINPAGIVDHMYVKTREPVPLAQQGSCPKVQQLIADGQYDSAVRMAPDCAYALVMQGEAAFRRKDFKAALDRYDRAIEISPTDGALYLFRANALRELNRDREADTALIWSLALRPRNSAVMAQLKKQGKLTDFPFLPRAFVRKEGEKWRIYTDKEKPYWIGYGACKALWMSDAKYRGKATYSFSTNEELECLHALVATYAAKHDRPDPQLDYLAGIIKKKQDWAWVQYELASRVDPLAISSLSDAQQKKVFDFVAKYIAVDR